MVREVGCFQEHRGLVSVMHEIAVLPELRIPGAERSDVSRLVRATHGSRAGGGAEPRQFLEVRAEPFFFALYRRHAIYEKGLIPVEEVFAKGSEVLGLGRDHEGLTVRHAGRDYRLTDVHGNVVKEVLV